MEFGEDLDLVLDFQRENTSVAVLSSPRQSFLRWSFGKKTPRNNTQRSERAVHLTRIFHLGIDIEPPRKALARRLRQDKLLIRPIEKARVSGAPIRGKDHI